MNHNVSTFVKSFLFFSTFFLEEKERKDDNFVAQKDTLCDSSLYMIQNIYLVQLKNVIKKSNDK